MDKITPNMLMTFLVVAAALGAFIVLILNIEDKIKARRKPYEDVEKRVSALEKDLKLLTEQSQKTREGVKATCRGVNAILTHMITGNSVDSMKKAQASFTNDMIDLN